MENMYDFGAISLIFSDSICLHRNRKRSKGKHETEKLEILYILLLPVFCKSCFLCSFVPKHLLQTLLHEAFEKGGKNNYSYQLFGFH